MASIVYYLNGKEMDSDIVDRVLQDDEELIEFYKENRELHQPGVILNTSMSTLFS